MSQPQGLDDLLASPPAPPAAASACAPGKG